MLLNLIEKGAVHFFFAILAYVHDALWKRQLIASFSKALKGISWKRNVYEFVFF